MSKAGKGKSRRRNAEATREHVLDVAHALFYWTGIRATGVDRVAAEAGIAPTALYRLFPSKDALVTAYLERTEQRYHDWFERATHADGRSAAERIVALFGELSQQVQPEVCRGCPFAMAVTEFPDATLDAHQLAIRLKRWVRMRMRRLAAELAAERAGNPFDVAEVADHLTLLFEGVYATVPTLGANGPAKRARALVAALVAPSRPSTPEP
jgi:AcrR family transcriptional regulator